MLAVFKKGIVNPPKELHCPAGGPRPTNPEQSLSHFLASNPSDSISFSFPNTALLAYSSHQRMLCSVNGVYCIFKGRLDNLCALNKQYGLSKKSDEAMFVIEAYCTLRDRGPFPAHQVLKELEGSFGFVLYDNTTGAVFAAVGGTDKGVSLYWGVAADGSVLISDAVETIKAGCVKSFAPFPAGCMYHSEGGLMSYEHPKNKMKAMPRIDSEGAMCGAYFAVDAYSQVKTMPRVGSEANWAMWG